MFGAMTDGAVDLVGDNAQTKEMLERMGGQAGVTDSFLAAMVGMLAMVAALYVVQSVLRLNGEETAQRAEPLLANAVGRIRWATGHLAVAFGGGALIMLIGGLGLGIGYGKPPKPPPSWAPAWSRSRRSGCSAASRFWSTASSPRPRPRAGRTRGCRWASAGWARR